MGFYRSLATLRVLVRRVGFCVLIVPASLPALGLGLGALQHQSSLGEPLAATIEIVSGKEDLDLYQIHTKQLSALQASELGIELVSTFQRYQLKPQRQNGQLIIVVSSDNDIKEPFINLLVELSWPDGRVYREYTLLLDPPGLAAAEGSAKQSPSPSSASAKQRSKPQITASASRYRVQPGDSLSKIAQQLTLNTGLRRHETMDWLLSHNPQAFINGDKNRIKAGAQLTLPQGSELTRVSQPRQKNSQAALPPAPAQIPSSVRAPVAPPLAAITTPETSSAVVDEQTRLTLTTERQDAQRLMRSNPDDLSVSQLQSRLDAVNELNERLMRDSREMQERLRLVEGSSYMQNLEDLLALKESQVAALKRQLDQQSGMAVTEQSNTTRFGNDDQLVGSVTGQDKGESQRITSNTAAEFAKPKPALAATRSYLWWWVLIVIGFLGLGLFYWLGRGKNNPEPTKQQPADNGIDEVLTLDELDELMASQGEDVRPIPLRPEPAKDESTPAAKASALKAASPSRAAPLQQSDPSKSKREGWRPDGEVITSIQEKMQAYTPPVYEESGVKHHDEIEGLIAEAISYGKKGYYDTAEALLHAERARTGANQRLDEAIEFLRKKKNDNPWESR